MRQHGATISVPPAKNRKAARLCSEDHALFRKLGIQYLAIDLDDTKRALLFADIGVFAI
ncbi:hypothetical protein C7449_1092 [Mycoplana dimorpha]|uniref:Uncharacterized protein n=1 Tax=Mycoplana dimorpha TaxID=28320 RepID=A0A2T5AXF4_MYCDI|nr:hypothetical protein C7449_1092 [Mycoplana dimorpha]